VGGLLSGGLLAGAVGLALARETLLRVVAVQPRSRTWLTPLVLGAGVIVGQTISPAGALDIGGAGLLNTAQLAFVLIYVCAVLITLAILLGWLRASLEPWLRIGVYRQSARLSMAICLGGWALGLGLWFGILLSAPDIGSTLLLAEQTASAAVPHRTVAFGRGRHWRWRADFASHRLAHKAGAARRGARGQTLH
jgi:hypothetical protein